jgi:hypothetical protein
MQSTLPKPMTSDRYSHFEGNFVLSKLPWILAAALLTVYLLTLNHWIALGNLVSAARLSGWTCILTFSVRSTTSSRCPAASASWCGSIRIEPAGGDLRRAGYSSAGAHSGTPALRPNA